MERFTNFNIALFLSVLYVFVFSNVIGMDIKELFEVTVLFIMSVYNTGIFHYASFMNDII